MSSRNVNLSDEDREKLGHCPIMQNLRIEALQENPATMVEQIKNLENKVFIMEAKIEKLENGYAKPKKHRKK